MYLLAAILWAILLWESREKVAKIAAGAGCLLGMIAIPVVLAAAVIGALMLWLL